MTSHHKHTATSLSSNHCAPCQKHIPHSIPPCRIFCNHLLLITHPIIMPHFNRSCIVHSAILNTMHLKPCSFQLGNDPRIGSRCIRTGKNILSHKQNPDNILKRPSPAPPPM